MIFPRRTPVQPKFRADFALVVRRRSGIFWIVKRGKKREELRWQDREWMATWEAWIEYQKAMRKYENSNAFKALLNELRGVD